MENENQLQNKTRRKAVLILAVVPAAITVIFFILLTTFITTPAWDQVGELILICLIVSAGFVGLVLIMIRSRRR